MIDIILHLFHNDHGEWNALGLFFSDNWTWIRAKLATWAPSVQRFLRRTP